jgi:transcriptional regulator with XRE-family HTH domain
MRPVAVQSRAERAAIGSRLRAVRQERQMTIEHVADGTGLSKGFISRIERDKVSPSVSTLVAICDVLNVMIGDLFISTDAQLVRKDETPKINLGGDGAQERLLTPRRESRVQVIRSTIEPGGNGGAELYTVSSEVDVMHVLTGQVQVSFSDGEATLDEGDTITFDGREPHSWRSADGAEVVWVLVPAAWSGTT